MAEYDGDKLKLHRQDRLQKKVVGACAHVRKNIKSSLFEELTQIQLSFHHNGSIYKARKVSHYLCVSLTVLLIVLLIALKTF